MQALTIRVLTLFLIIMGYSPIYASQSAKMVNGFEGVLEIRAANYILKQNRTPSEIIQYVLKVNENTSYPLVFTSKEPANLKTGQRVKISKALLETNTTGERKLLVSPADIQIVKTLSIQAIPDAFGPQKTLVMLVNFQNQRTEPWTTTQVKDTVFNVGNGMINEFSYQQTSIVGDVVGWYTVALPNNSPCESITNTLPSLARTAATAAGVNLSLYNRFIYMFPFVSNCQWAGLASVGGNPSTAWINGLNRADAIVHEFGHNLGLYHAHSLECTGGANTGSCVSEEYGDLADTMGYPYTYLGPHFNAFQKERLGWLNYGNSPQIQTVTTTGNYTINNYENTVKNVKALKVLRASNSTSNDYYYLEFRQGIGYDKFLPTCTDCDFAKGVLVHQGNMLDPRSSYMLDMSPLDNNKSKLVTLLPGNSYTDANAPSGGVTFKVVSISPTNAVVNVTFGKTPPSDCVRGTPQIQINPGYGVIKVGQTRRFDVRVTNTDSLACAKANFTFTAAKIHDQIPVAWTPTTASIAPGTSQNVVVTVYSSTSTPTGYYDVRVNAVSDASPSSPVFSIGTLEVRK